MNRLFSESMEFENLRFQDKALVTGDYENCSFTNCDFSNSDLSDLNFIECEFLNRVIASELMGVKIY